MRIFQFVIIAVIIAGLAFGTGYFMGAMKISELNSKITSLNENLKDKEFCLLLFKVKDQARAALIDMSEKNFGLANQKIADTKEVLTSDIENISEKRKVSIDRVSSMLTEIQVEIDNLNIKTAVEKVNLLIGEIDKIPHPLRGYPPPLEKGD